MSDIIQVAYGELTTSFENEVMKAVQQVGINVNKEELLKALELADKLVYCKDCKHLRYCETEDLDLYLDCDCPDGGGIPRNEDWYCADGERKDNEVLQGRRCNPSNSETDAIRDGS